MMIVTVLVMVTVKRERRKNKRERESSVGNTTGTRFGNGTEHYGNARNEGNITGTCSRHSKNLAHTYKLAHRRTS